MSDYYLYRFMSTLNRLQIPEDPKYRPNMLATIKSVRVMGSVLNKLYLKPIHFGLRESKDYTEKYWPDMWFIMCERVRLRGTGQKF